MILLIILHHAVDFDKYSLIRYWQYSCIWEGNEWAAAVYTVSHCVSLCLCVRFAGLDKPSGFGFELTFRLKRELGETAPPTWPAELMQGLARYVFQSGNKCVCVCSALLSPHLEAVLFDRMSGVAENIIAPTDRP